MGVGYLWISQQQFFAPGCLAIFSFHCFSTCIRCKFCVVSKLWVKPSPFPEAEDYFECIIQCFLALLLLSILFAPLCHPRRHSHEADRWEVAEDGSRFHKNTPMSQFNGKFLSEPKDCRISLPLILFCKHNKSEYLHPVRDCACACGRMWPSILFFCDVMEDSGHGCLFGLLSVYRVLSSGGKSHGSPLVCPVGGGWRGMRGCRTWAW